MKTQSLLQEPKVALVYDHLTTNHGGAELVLQILLEAFPSAPLFTSVFDPRSAKWAVKKTVHTSFLQSLPFKKLHQIWAPLHPLAFESLDLSEYDVILSISSGGAKGVMTLPYQLHVCYLLTPTRYLFRQDGEHEQYLASQKIFQIPGMKQVTQPLFQYLEKWDTVAAWRPDKIIAISQLVADRIKKIYQREVDSIVYPPFRELPKVNSEKVPPFFLSLGRLVSYKRIDTAIKAALRAGTTLAVAGDGVYKSKLHEVANNKAYSREPYQTVQAALQIASQLERPIVFLGTCSEQEKSFLLQEAQALVMPGEEDFGLIGLEAASAGTPVITFHKSGIAEVLTAPTTAVHLDDHKIATLTEAFRNFVPKKYDKLLLKRTAAQHTSEEFKKELRNTIYHFWQQHSTI